MAAYGAQPFSMQLFYNGEAAIPAHTPIMVTESLDNGAFQIYGNTQYLFNEALLFLTAINIILT